MMGFPAARAGSWILFSFGSHICRMISGGRKRPVLNATSSAVQMKSTPFFTAAAQNFAHHVALTSSMWSTSSRSS